MRWVGIILVAPLWGILSAQLFLQSWLAVANMFIALAGFVGGAVRRKTTAMMMGVAVAQVVLFSLLLGGGFWLLTEVLPFGRTRLENGIYWAFAACSALFMLLQVPSKVRKSWRDAMVPGALEGDIISRKLRVASERAIDSRGDRRVQQRGVK